MLDLLIKRSRAILWSVRLAEESGLFKKVSTRYELPDGNKQYAKTINNEQRKIFHKRNIRED